MEWGIIIIDVDNPENITLIDTTYLSYYTTNTNTIPYQVVLDVEFDIDGNMWVANPYCNNGNSPIHVMSQEGVWRHYGSNETETSLSHTPISIDFDSFGRTWVSSFQASGINVGLPNGEFLCSISLANLIILIVFHGPRYIQMEQYGQLVWVMVIDYIISLHPV